MRKVTTGTMQFVLRVMRWLVWSWFTSRSTSTENEQQARTIEFIKNNAVRDYRRTRVALMDAGAKVVHCRGHNCTNLVITGSDGRVFGREYLDNPLCRECEGGTSAEP